MALSKTLVSSLLLILMMIANKANSQPPDTTTFTYNTFTSPSPSGLTYQGDAFVPSGSSFLRLTRTDASGNPTRGSIGRVVYSNPVAFWEPGRQASFETTIEFLIRNVNNDPADGITFFIIPVNTPIPSASSGGNFGIFSGTAGTAPAVFAVEFDVYANGWDPRYRHVGIDINSRTSRNTTRLDVPIGANVITARINYVSSTRTISVFVYSGSTNNSLSYVFDLKTVLPQQVQVGLSATTGEQTAIHDIRYWYYSSTLIWDGNNNNEEEAYIKQYV